MWNISREKHSDYSNKPIDNLDDLNEKLAIMLDKVFEFLNIDLSDYRVSDNCIRGYAPCHGGDNSTGFVFYMDTFRWRCWTHGCHEQYYGNIIGLIRAVTKKSWKDSIQFAKEILKNNPVSDEMVFNLRPRKPKRNIWEEHINQKIYNFSDIGALNSSLLYCKKRKLDYKIVSSFGAAYAYAGVMKGRFVIPVRNINGSIVGFTGRTTKNDNNPKWLHWPSSKREEIGFKKDINIFNLDRVVLYNERTRNKSIILVEGPIDVFKWIMADIPYCGAILGDHISQGQIELLKHCGFSDIILALDNDNAGKKALERNARKLERHLFTLYKCIPSNKDWGEMKVADIKKSYDNKEKIL
jgi:hypothetical protein